MPRQVDIFIPVTPQLVSSQKSFKMQYTTPAKSTPAISNDVIRPPRKRPPLDHLRPRYPRPISQVAAATLSRKQSPALLPSSPTAIVRPQLTPPVMAQSKKKPRHGRRAAKLAVTGGAMLTIGLLLQAAVYGELLICVYAIFALVRRVESRTTFMLALISLGCILVMLLLRPNLALMQNFAIYAFLLLFVGTMSLVAETRY